jgi:hypothetical protein
MAYTNDFLAFAGASTANVMTQASYVASSWLTLGFSTGTAQSPQLNKVWRQGSLIAHTVGAFMAAYGPGNVVDDGTTNGQATLLTQFTQAVTQVAMNAVPTTNFLPLSGGTLTGGVTSTASATGTGATPQLKIQPTSPSSDAVFQLNRTLGNNALIYGMNTAGTPRWSINLGNTDAENTGPTDAGSNFSIGRYHDHDSLAGVTPPFHAGDLIDYPVFINRSTGVVVFSKPPQVGADPTHPGNLPYLALDGTAQMAAGADIRAQGLRFSDESFGNSLAFTWTGTPAALHVWQAVAGGTRADRGAIALQSWVTGLNYLADAPSDNSTYARRNAQWTSIVIPATRTRLTTGTNFYVSSTAGNDTNSGLTASVPWKTLTHAYNVLRSNYDLAGFTAFIQCADGTYDPMTCTGGYDGGISVLGNQLDASKVIITGQNNGPAVQVNSDGRIAFDHVSFGGSGTRDCLNVTQGVVSITNVIFGVCGGAHIDVGADGIVSVGAPYSTSSTATCSSHWSCGSGGFISTNGYPITINSSPNVTAFAQVTAGAVIYTVDGSTGATTTFSGSVMNGPRYYVTTNGVLYTGTGGNVNYLPASQPGSTIAGGQYY